MYQGKRVIVLGLGASGKAAAQYLQKQGAHVFGVDRNQEVVDKAAISAQVEDQIQHLANFDLMVLSPGIPLTHRLCQMALQSGIEVIGEIELGCRAIANSNPILGITGTNGKTTTTLLIAHILNHAGKKAHALGNVGVPLTQEILSLKKDEIVVLELSSYQLETLQQRVLTAGVILNVTPDHLDRYGTMEAYAASKFAMEKCLKNADALYIEENTYNKYGYLLNHPDAKTYGYSKQNFLHTDLEKVFVREREAFVLPASLQGRKNHDLENLLAAYALCRRLNVTPEQFLDALKTFKKPSHRIEWVTDQAGVAYYDDSKGTNVDAVIRAVESLQGNIILIAGGVDKGSSYMPWLAGFTNRVKCICAIGQAAPKIKHELSKYIPVTIFESLEQAVKQAAQIAQAGDNVLLSPGCSSFDMFRDYAHRGQEFQRIVRNMKGEKNE